MMRHGDMMDHDDWAQRSVPSCNEDGDLLLGQHNERLDKVYDKRRIWTLHT